MSNMTKILLATGGDVPDRLWEFLASPSACWASFFFLIEANHPCDEYARENAQGTEPRKGDLDPHLRGAPNECQWARRTTTETRLVQQKGSAATNIACAGQRGGYQAGATRRDDGWVRGQGAGGGRGLKRYEPPPWKCIVRAISFKRPSPYPLKGLQKTLERLLKGSRKCFNKSFKLPSRVF